MVDDDWDRATLVWDERSRLLALGYRMLGCQAEAEDAVQETFLRWYRLEVAERARIEVPAAWLTTAMTRVCLNVLSSARHRHEAYVGEWLPEPLASGSPLANTLGRPAAHDPAERAAVVGEVTMALMVLLESLTPSERVALVLHDVFGYKFTEIAQMLGDTPQAVRKRASNARKRVAAERRGDATAHQQRDILESFLSACSTGDVEAVVARLDPNAVAVSDGGGHVRTARRPVVGADRVARFFIGASRKATDLEASLEETPVETRIVLRRGSVVAAVIAIRADGERIRNIWMVMNPAKLHTWNEVRDA